MGLSSDIDIRSITVQDYGAVKQFLHEHYFKSEPLCLTSDEDIEKCNEQDTDNYNLSLIKQGTSLKAVERSTGRIVGLVLSDAQYPSDLEKHRKRAEGMPMHILGRILRFLSKLERKASIFERYGVNKVLYSHRITVDKSMRGKGLGGRLISALMDVGRAQGFPVMIAFCTSYYSARQMESLGMECVHSQLYSEYKDDQGRVVFNPSPPHTKVHVMAMQL